MRRPIIIVLLILIAVALAVWLTGDRGDELAVDAILKRQRQQEQSSSDESRDSQVDLDVLTPQGKGLKLPPHLSFERHPSGDFWFVGSEKFDPQARVPFLPGMTPRAVSDSKPLSDNPGFLGADACRSCHPDQYNSFVDTAHHRTSRLATSVNISGSLADGDNRLETASRDVSFTMIKRQEKFYQRASFFDWQFDVPMDLVIGSAKMGESYAYWHGERLYQLNATYLTKSDEWINSPGYIDGDAEYARPIQPGCIECHSTYVDVRKLPNQYTPNSLILGVSCERCHGPGQQHVDYHQANPNAKGSRHVTVPSKLPRQAEMDVCGQCHTSNRRLHDRPAYQFRPGDQIADHYTMVEASDKFDQVHTSNQVSRLELSECFQNSEMGCVECHNPHKNERGQLKLFSQRCLTCHEEAHCGVDRDSLTFDKTTGQSLSDNCIDCHMPIRAGKLHVETAAGTIFPPLRDHHIRVDKRATDEFINANAK